MPLPSHGGGSTCGVPPVVTPYVPLPRSGARPGSRPRATGVDRPSLPLAGVVEGTEGHPTGGVTAQEQVGSVEEPQVTIYPGRQLLSSCIADAQESVMPASLPEAGDPCVADPVDLELDYSPTQC